MRAVCRSASLVLAALAALVSCGVPTTGVVEAGGPASGVVPTIRIYLVVDGTLIAVPRRTVAPVDVESAVDVLLQGPSDAERAKRLTTLLPLPGPLPTAAPAAPPTGLAVRVPQEARASDLVKVATQGDRVSLELSAVVNDLAVAQLICTAVGAQRIADPGSEPGTVTVTGPDGRPVEGSGEDCPTP
ncbi:hypothetical protein ABT063_41340 [Streptomyces sp. NPDC002838]|uniref:hypothetical protein n=1 Tax=Streptomyces sp. NPDC002838 TaxID=3154436 RepID=UPI0033294D23